MEREVRHPLLFAVCGFMLCIMFAGNLVQAREAAVDREDANKFGMYDYSLVNQQPLAHKRAFRVRGFGKAVVYSGIPTP